MKEIIISKTNHGQRADKFVRKYLNEAPLSFIYKLFRIRDVKVNGKRISSDFILSEGDLMQLYVNDNLLEEFSKPRVVAKANFDLDIVYEDNNILIVNKPSGILIHGDHSEKRITLANVVLNYLYEKGEFNPNDKTFTPAPGHRLDRNTSGLVVFAKNILALKAVEELFKEKTQIKKEYLTLVAGRIYDSDKIDAPLFKDEKKNTVYVRSIKNGGKNALTYYKSEKVFKDYSLLSIQIITGRTHQIRVHLSYINHPVMGDSKYGNFDINKRFEEKYNYKNQFLHAYKLSFLDVEGYLSYLSNKIFISPLPKKEKEIIDKLEVIV